MRNGEKDKVFEGKWSILKINKEDPKQIAEFLKQENQSKEREQNNKIVVHEKYSNMQKQIIWIDLMHYITKTKWSTETNTKILYEITIM